MTETSTQQRPWAAVAPWPEGNDRINIRLHFAAMVVAHSRAYDAFPFTDRDAQRVAIDQHLRPMVAAFIAAAMVGDDCALDQAVASLNADEAVRLAWQWLTAAGINPAEIEAAS